MTNAYMFIALIIASGSCQEPRLIVQNEHPHRLI
jgi:hypothetical protein